MEQTNKEKLWRKLKDPQTSRQQAFELLQGFADFWFERGWRRHKRTRRAILTWEGWLLKKDFDEWYDKNIARYPMDDLEEIQNIVYSHIPQTHTPKNDSYE